ncbi:RES family NAD+ phosphorylase [Allopusillimonas soli]|uniref:RES family NAD+ phosphorylase n=1 Tax=Allopusillimonas soli TaxID=659016 RepID=A0A853FES1_9BURK|nr:RES family NAD+ phosphorylase [Allopusillimonas soli]NYT38188.1 RES family NAD+ phosphorylase [Allopusillimonas soli]
METTLQQLVQSSDEVIKDIAEALQFMWYDRDSGEYQYGDDEPWFVLKSRMESPLSQGWTLMENSLRSEARYLNPKVAQFMESIFGGIADDIAENGSSVLVDVGPETHSETLYRARVFQSEKSMGEALRHPERFLGAPAAGVGAGGRMNAAGQPAFYGATDVQTALAEVRPPVGSWVVVAQFSITRALKLLDLKRLSQITLSKNASLFDPGTKAAAERRDFLRLLCEKIVAPVMPESQERNYLITQVVADYLSVHPRASIDGIIYPSVQRSSEGNSSSGENIVLFHKAATATHADREGATADVDLWEYEEGEPNRYFRPRIMYLPDKPQDWLWSLGYQPKPALQLVRDSLQIHRVQCIDIRTDVTPLEVESVDLWGKR